MFLFIESKAALLCVILRERESVFCIFNLGYNFLIQLLPLQSSVFVVHFPNAFWHWNKAFPKGSSQNKSSPRNLFFTMWLIQKCKNMFSFVSLTKSKFFTCIALVSFVQHLHRTLVALVSFLLHLCRTCSVRDTSAWLFCMCSKIDQIKFSLNFLCNMNQSLTNKTHVDKCQLTI